MVLAAGAEPERISFGNTIKKENDIASRLSRGRAAVRLRQRGASSTSWRARRPARSVFCRILDAGEGADWPLSRKFGCAPEMAVDAADRGAATLGVDPYGVSFHVGSQQTDLGHGTRRSAPRRGMFRAREAEASSCGMVNIGGGFPAHYRGDVPAMRAYGAGDDGRGARGISATACPRSSSSRAARWSATPASSRARSC